jgi:hypothetical protein
MWKSPHGHRVQYTINIRIQMLYTSRLRRKVVLHGTTVKVLDKRKRPLQGLRSSRSVGSKLHRDDAVDERRSKMSVVPTTNETTSLIVPRGQDKMLCSPGTVTRAPDEHGTDEIRCVEGRTRRRDAYRENVRVGPANASAHS